MRVIFDALANFAYTTVTVAPSTPTAGTTMSVASGAVFPAVPFNAVVWPTGTTPGPTNAEIVRVTENSAGALKITRTTEAGGINRSIKVGDQIMMAITKHTLLQIIEALEGLPVVQASAYGFKTTATAPVNTAAMEAAIAALPAKGGIVEVEMGQFVHEGINCKERSNITIRGQGGRSAGGGLGANPYLGVSESATQFADTRGAGTLRSIDMRNGTTCKLVGISAIVFNKNWPASSLIWDLTNHTVPGCMDVTIEASGEGGTVVPAWGVGLRGICNSGSFYDLMVKGCTISLVGPTTSGEESVAHNFYNFTSYGHQQVAIFNPYQDWNFYGGSIEERRDNKGVLNGAGAVDTSFACYSLHFYGTWIGGDKTSATETGVQIRWQGYDFRMEGGQLSNAATLLECVGVCDKVVVDGTLVTLATNGVSVTSGTERLRWEPTVYPGGVKPVTNMIVGTYKAWSTRVTRAAATAFTPSTKGDTEVMLTLKTKTAVRTLLEIVVGGVVVSEVEASVAATGQSIFPAFIKVPAGLTWEVKVKEGTLDEMLSSYRAV